MEYMSVNTGLGALHLGIDARPGTRPVVFLHGLFLDKTLWSPFAAGLTGRTHIAIDMPAHGASASVGRPWRAADVVEALMMVLDHLDIRHCTLIGHSWGAITALRALDARPERFDRIGLFNMPFLPPRAMQRAMVPLQKLLALSPRLYASQIARALYSEGFLHANPTHVDALRARLARRPWRETAWTIDAVIAHAADLRPLLERLEHPAIAVVGERDQVTAPPGIDTVTVAGGHVSPHEAADAVREVIRRLCG